MYSLRILPVFNSYTFYSKTVLFCKEIWWVTFALLVWSYQCELWQKPLGPYFVKPLPTKHGSANQFPYNVFWEQDPVQDTFSPILYLFSLDGIKEKYWRSVSKPRIYEYISGLALWEEQGIGNRKPILMFW